MAHPYINKKKIEAVRLVKKKFVDHKGWRRRPKIGEDVMASDMRKLWVCEKDVGNRIKWMCRTRLANLK